MARRRNTWITYPATTVGRRKSGKRKQLTLMQRSTAWTITAQGLAHARKTPWETWGNVPVLSADSNQSINRYVLAHIFGISSSIPKTDAILSAIMVLHFVLSTAGHIGLSDPNLLGIYRWYIFSNQKPVESVDSSGFFHQTSRLCHIHVCNDKESQTNVLNSIASSP